MDTIGPRRVTWPPAAPDRLSDNGLAERIRTVDGHLTIDSPADGPTSVTVELPSHA
jgi:hypothetical protein